MAKYFKEDLMTRHKSSKGSKIPFDPRKEKLTISLIHPFRQGQTMEIEEHQIEYLMKRYARDGYKLVIN
jgi:hypothetical protein